MTTRQQAIAAYTSLLTVFKARSSEQVLHDYVENQVATQNIAGDYDAIAELINTVSQVIKGDYKEQIWKDAGKKYYLETGSYPYGDPEFPMGMRAVAGGRYLSSDVWSVIGQIGIDKTVEMNVGDCSEWRGEYTRIVFRRAA